MSTLAQTCLAAHCVRSDATFLIYVRVFESTGLDFVFFCLFVQCLAESLDACRFGQQFCRPAVLLAPILPSECTHKLGQLDVPRILDATASLET